MFSVDDICYFKIFFFCGKRKLSLTRENGLIKGNIVMCANILTVFLSGDNNVLRIICTTSCYQKLDSRLFTLFTLLFPSYFWPRALLVFFNSTLMRYYYCKKHKMFCLATEVLFLEAAFIFSAS